MGLEDREFGRRFPEVDPDLTGSPFACNLRRFMLGSSMLSISSCDCLPPVVLCFHRSPA